MNVKADLMLRDVDGTVLTTVDDFAGPVNVGDAVILADRRGSGDHEAQIAWIDLRAGQVGVKVLDEATKLERFHAESAFASLMNTARDTARRAYDTGDREQTAICVREHLQDVPMRDIVHSDRYECPVCGHLIKDRSGQGR